MHRPLAIFLILIAVSAQATTIVVPGDAPTIQGGIDSAAAGDTVLVAPGTYEGPGNYNIDFGGKDIVLLAPAGPDSTTILVKGSAAEPRRGFIFQSGETSAARVEGFTIQNGHHEAEYKGGGGAWITNSSPSFVSCRFRNCYGYWGGAVRLAYSEAVFLNCWFEDNSASHGGAVYCQYQSDATFHECTFKGNRAEEGGGVVFRWCFAPVVTNCVFDGNAASRYGGGILTKEGAAPLIEHCNLLRNQADTGGSGLYVSYSSGPPTVNNCIIAYGHDAPGVTADTGFFSCCNIVGHSSEDMEGAVAQQLGQNGNISLPVRFCGWSRADYYLSEESPCAPENNACGELIGLRGVGDCAPEYRTWWVNPEGTGDAPTIQAAIDSALDYDTVMLAPGVYSGEGNRDIHFQAKSITVRSQAGAEQTIVECGGTEAVPHRGFIARYGEDSTTMLRGVWIRNAYAPADAVPIGFQQLIKPKAFGGGILVARSFLTAEDLRIDSCYADYGGGICYYNRGRGVLRTSSVLDNTVIGGGLGAGVAIVRRSFADIQDCYFSGNWGTYGTSIGISDTCSAEIQRCVAERSRGGRGCGLAVLFYSDPVIEDCVFRWNYAGDAGGGIYWAASGGVIRRCTVIENEAESTGGGLCLRGSSTPVIEDCVIACNYTPPTNEGGGMYMSAATPTIRRCTFSGNQATHGSGIYMELRGVCPDTIKQCIFVFGIYGGSAIESDDAGPLPVISCCNSYGNRGGNWELNFADQLGVNGNISEDPDFLGRLRHDYRLMPYSPCAPANTECGEVMGADLGFPDRPPRAWRVNPDGTGDAPTIQEAIYLTYPGDTVLLSNGVFSGEGNHDNNFLGQNIILRSEHGPDSTIIDCQGTYYDWANAFFFMNWETRDAVVEGVTIKNGWDHVGAGMHMRHNTAPTIRNCVFNTNIAENVGGAAFVYGSEPLFEDCVFHHNRGDSAGAVMLFYTRMAEFRRCTFASNLVWTRGGAMVCAYSGATIDNCIVYKSDHPSGPSILCLDVDSMSISCTNLYANHHGDWIGYLERFANMNGNLTVDPMFCDTAAANYRLVPGSPCGPDGNTCGELIGARPVGCDPTGVDDEDDEPTLPDDFALSQNYPNPFNPSTTIAYALPVNSHVRLSIFNVLGQEVIKLVDADQPAGEHTVVWDGRTPDGREVATGVYLYRITAGDFTETRKMLLVK